MLTILLPTLSNPPKPASPTPRNHPSDAPVIFKMRSDERVMQYIGKPPQKDISEAEQQIQNYLDACQQNDGWAVAEEYVTV